MRPSDELELAEALRGRAAPVFVQGGGTRRIVAALGEAIDTSGLTGVRIHEPGALTLVAGAGTPLAEVEAVLAEQRQRLAFEVPDLRRMLGRDGVSTLGGVAAANASGSRRVQVGACRDQVLGLRFVNGAGVVVKAGGRVMKNVTGLDLTKLLVGSQGRLGVITELAFRVQAVPEAVATLVGLRDLASGLATLRAALGSPYDVSGAAYAGGQALIRVEGMAGSVAYLIGCLVIGPRIGFNKEPMPPHSLTMTMIGASLLWVGWFGFNAGSNLEANGLAALAFLNTFVATAAAALSWMIVEQLHHGRPSLLGAVTGAVAGLVVITPACGFASPMGAVLLGLIVSPICYTFVSTVKGMLKYDDSLDVFGVHCIGGIVGAIGTAIVANPSYGGQGWFDYTVFPAVAGAYDMAAQLMTQTKAVLVTLVWSGVVSFVLFTLIKLVFGLRPSLEDERQGLDQTSHGETAYNM